MADYKFGICLWTLPAQGLTGLEKLSTLGIEGVELDLISSLTGFSLMKKNFRNYIKYILRNSNLKFPSLATNEMLLTGMTTSFDSTKGDKVKKLILDAIEAALYFDIPVIQFPSFHDGEIVDEKGFYNTCQFLDYALQNSKDTNLIISNENILNIVSNKKLIKDINNPRFKIFFDMQNYVLEKGLDNREIIFNIGTHFCQIHAKDGVDKISNRLLGDGDADFDGTVEALKEVNYEGWIILENFHDQIAFADPELDAEDMIKEDIKRLKNSFL